MENLEMSDNSSGISQSSSSTDHDAPSKRQKINESNASSFKIPEHDSVARNEEEPKRIWRALEFLRTNLTQTEATAIQHHKLQAQTEGMPEREKTLKEQLQTTKEIIYQFRGNLEALMTSVHDARAEQAAAEAKVSQLKSTVGKHIAETVGFLQNETARQKQLFKDKMSTVEKELVQIQQQVKLLEEQRRESTSKSRKCKTTKAGGTVVVSKDEYYDLLQKNEILKFQLEVSREEKGEVGHVDADKSQKAVKIARNIEESSSDEEQSSPDPDGHDLNAVESVAERKNGEPDVRIKLGKYYGLVSDRRFLEMDWTKEYVIISSNRARCLRCSVSWMQVAHIKDHVWSKHYEGKFICAYCVNSPKTYSSKENLRRHILQKHSGMC